MDDKKACSLYQNKFAEKIIITGNNVLIGKGKQSEENDINLSKIKNYFLANKTPEKTITIARNRNGKTKKVPKRYSYD